MPDSFVYCSRCGTRNNATAQFCQRCGWAIAPNPSSTPQLVPAAPAPATITAVAPAYAPLVVAAGPHYGGFWIRFAAFLLDTLILGFLYVPVFLLFVLPSLIKAINEINREEPPTELFGVILLMVPLYWVVGWLYEALTTSSSWQGTVGKRVLGLKVTDETGNRISFGRASGRFFGKLLSNMIMHIGFIMIAFTDRKRGLHDMLAGTLVIRA